MTVSELYRSVAQLGFEDNLEDDSRFLFSANRALLQVNALRPATGTLVINHKPMQNKVKENTFAPILVTGELCFEASDVKSFYFEADGNGVVHAELFDPLTETWSCIKHVDPVSGGGFKAYRGLLKQDGQFTSGLFRLRFTGEYLYSVKNVAMYEYLKGPNVEDIPAFEPYTRYDVSEIVSDFLSLCPPPMKEEAGFQYLSDGYDVENGRTILLPHDAEGLYKIVYNRRPTPITCEGDAVDEETVIDLDEELCALLPLLVASLVWVDDEPEKAQYYLALYQGRAADIERRRISCTPVPFKIVDGW